MEIAIAVGTGLVVGIIAGVLGIGGGAFQIAAMVLLLERDQHTAQGVSLAVILLTSLLGTYVHHRQHNVDLHTVLWIAPAAIVVAFLSGTFAGLLPEDILQRLFAVLLLYLGIRMYRSR